MKKSLVPVTTALMLGLGSLAVPTLAPADSPFEMMNPFEWFFDDDDDDWYYRRHGPGYGYGGPWGPGGWGGYPGYRPPVVIQTAKAKPTQAPAPKLPE